RVTGGGTAAIQVDRTGATGTEVHVNHAATGSEDFTAVSGTLTIPAGHTSSTFTVPTFADGVAAGDKTLALTLSAPTNGATLGSPATAKLTITDVDSIVQFVQPVYTVKESVGTALISLNRSGGTTVPAVVAYSVTPGTAVPGRDFTPGSGTVSFKANETKQTFPVTIKNDSIID